MIVIQSVLTAALAICIAVNAIIVTCKENPHTKKRKELEKQREADLTPLDARNSLLGGPLSPRGGPGGKGRYSLTPTQDTFHFNDTSGQSNFPLHHMTPAPDYPPPRSVHHSRNESLQSASGESLVRSAAPMPFASAPFASSGHERPHSSQYDDYPQQGRGY